jgi:hypothetical protein
MTIAIGNATTSQLEQEVMVHQGSIMTRGNAAWTNEWQI